MEKDNLSIYKIAMNYGLYFGLGLILISVVDYLAIDYSDMSFVAMGIVAFFMGLVPVIFCVLFSIRSYKYKVNNGYLKYAVGVRFGTLTMAFAGIIVACYTLIFNNFIDPTHTEKTQLIVAEKTIAYMESAGVPQADLDVQIAELEKGIDEAKRDAKGKGPLMSIPFFAFGGFIISLIGAAIYKKNPVDRFSDVMKDIE